MLFACAYAAIALGIDGQRKALWFVLPYGVGTLKPLSDALIPFVAFPEFLEWTGYAGFLAALLLMSPALRLFYGQPAGWRMVALVMAGGLALRALIFTWDRTSFAHGVAYQMPFIVAAMLGAFVVWHLPSRGRFHEVLCVMFTLLGAQFAVKPWIAASVGAGQTLADYTASRYAPISQALTGVTLLTIGLVLLLMVVRHALAEALELAERDPLSGLLNRRGLRARSGALVARGNVVAVSVDLDHFKQINDRFGHAMGDRVIVHFAGLLRAATAAVPGALLARLGGEEFIVLLSGSTATGLALADAIRAASAEVQEGLPPVTASIGVAEMGVGGSLDDLLRRADDATYVAKREGRNRVALAPVAALAA
ncbi:GGDEF domain-containing protein [Erythrobacter oryzae]|uniref:GGDEF domain-containing protein n=1 Tax=Erythrobacter oryzae TaxID=3019556 RepID=UPI00255367A8|nr:GGDEF domain-containing protein [Erythrobacter sp. COR-2]